MGEPLRMYDSQGRSLPDTVMLGPVGDPGPLSAEVTALRAAGAPLAATEGRRVLALHSPGGDPGRTDPGGPGLHAFARTPWFDRVPLLAEILRSLPAPLRSVRLLALAPRTVSTRLQTAKAGPPWGLCRLHLPLAGRAGLGAVFVDGKSHWQPGTLWFAASWRHHALVNESDEETVHAVIDIRHTAALAELFPVDLRARLRSPAVLEERPVTPLDAADLHRYACGFPLPETFTNWEQPGHLLPRNALRNVVPARIEVHGDALRLTVAGQPFCTLEHLGHGEFRMLGWSEERTLLVRRRGGAPVAVLVRAREGGYSYSASLPAKACG